jgi:hypothetical protein
MVGDGLISLSLAAPLRLASGFSGQEASESLHAEPLWTVPV